MEGTKLMMRVRDAKISKCGNKRCRICLRERRARHSDTDYTSTDLDTAPQFYLMIDDVSG